MLTYYSSKYLKKKSNIKFTSQEIATNHVHPHLSFNNLFIKMWAYVNF